MAKAPAAVTGLFGKLPAHGDFVRRELPDSFIEPWDEWLQQGMAAAREAMGEEAWLAHWDSAPTWRFALPAGACGPDPVAGVVATSADAVGRRFPLTAAAVLPGAMTAFWPAAWFAAVEGAVLSARQGGIDADTLAASLPVPEEDFSAEAPEPGWWTAGTAEAPGMVWPLPALPPAETFLHLLEPAA